MELEYKISLAILISGLIGMGGFIYYKKSFPKEQIQTLKEEKVILPNLDNQTIYQKLPVVQEYVEDIKKAIENGTGVVTLKSSELDSGAKIAQEILLKSSEFIKDNIINGKVTHSDIMRILPVNISDLNEKEKKICKKDNCYKAQKYNFYNNSTTEAIVDIKSRKILSIRHYSNSQPDISFRLRKIAEEIVLSSPEVAKELGHKPKRYEMSMANVRGAFQGDSLCEDSSHLCVAPTFAKHKEQKALWAIVDLSDLRLVIAKWAKLGKTTTPSCISQRSLENRYIMENFCKKDSLLEKDNWSIKYHLTASDGLEIRDVKFKNNYVIKSAKIVDWHVAYKGLGKGNFNSSEPIYMAGRQVEFVKDKNNSYYFGYNDAMGCPMFSTSVVLAFNAPQIVTIKDVKGESIGFSITQDFRNPKWPMACNYRYENRFEFYKDGSFRIVAVNKGRGCADNAIYRPVMRIDLFKDERESFSIFDGKGWQKWQKEDSYYSNSKETLYKNRYLYKISSKNLTYYVEPNRGKFGDGSRGDYERVYLTLFKEMEGDRDMMTLGSCCNLKLDGPERFIEPSENIIDKDLVLWYVPRIKNDNRKDREYCWADTIIGDDGNLEVRVWPCVVGPKFVPLLKDK